MIEIKITYAEIESQFVIDPPPQWAQDIVKTWAENTAKRLEEDFSLMIGGPTPQHWQETSWPPRALYPCGCRTTVCLCGGYRIS